MDQRQAQEMMNALWKPITRQRWQAPRSTRRISNYGTRSPFRSVTSGKVPKAPSMDDTIVQQTERGCILATTATHAALLYQDDYLRVLGTSSADDVFDWELAVDPTNGVPVPFALDRVGDKEEMLKRYDPFLVPGVYAILERILAACTVWAHADVAQESDEPLVEPGRTNPTHFGEGVLPLLSTQVTQVMTSRGYPGTQGAGDGHGQ